MRASGRERERELVGRGLKKAGRGLQDQAHQRSSQRVGGGVTGVLPFLGAFHLGKARGQGAPQALVGVGGRCPGVSRASGVFWWRRVRAPEGVGVGVVWGVTGFWGPGFWFQDAWIEGRERNTCQHEYMGATWEGRWGQIEFSMRRFQMNPMCV